MSNVRRTAAKRDKNEPDIVRALKSIGAVVVKVSEKGAPDLIVGYLGKTYLLEVKREDGGKLTEAQDAWMKVWRGGPVPIVRNAEDAVRALGLVVGPNGMWHRCPMDACTGNDATCREAHKHERGTYKQPKGTP